MSNLTSIASSAVDCLDLTMEPFYLNYEGDKSGLFLYDATEQFASLLKCA